MRKAGLVLLLVVGFAAAVLFGLARSSAEGAADAVASASEGPALERAVGAAPASAPPDEPGELGELGWREALPQEPGAQGSGGAAPATEAAPGDGPPALAGRVLDDRGEPVEAFALTVVDLDDASDPRTDTRSFRDAQGEFAWNVRTDGRGLYATAPGFEPSTVHRFAQHDPAFEVGFEVELVLRRLAVVSGRVLDPVGDAVGYAQIRRVTAHVYALHPPGYPVLANEARTDLAGHFELAISGTPCRLEAALEGYAASERLSLDLAPGARQDAALTLRVGGELVVEWHDWLGSARGRLVHLGAAGSYTRHAFDESGRLELPALVPGRYSVRVDSTGGEAGSDFDRLGLDASAEVRDGETTHLVLGGDLGTPVELRGRVTRAGRSVPSRHVVARRDTATSRVTTETVADGAGEYRLVVPGPGAYRLTVGFKTESAFEVAVEVPAVSRHQFDVELPESRLSGVVLGPDGSVVEGVQLAVRGGPSSGLASSGSGGQFEIRGLAPGRYALSAGPPRWGGRGAAPARTVGRRGGLTHRVATRGNLRRGSSPGRGARAVGAGRGRRGQDERGRDTFRGGLSAGEAALSDASARRAAWRRTSGARARAAVRTTRSCTAAGSPPNRSCGV